MFVNECAKQEECANVGGQITTQLLTKDTCKERLWLQTFNSDVKLKKF